MKPFVKWVGGKTQLLADLVKIVPTKFNCYFEPFLGGGALFLKIQPKKAILGDFNCQLITAWKIIQKSPQKLVQYLNDLTNNFNNTLDKKQFFLDQKINYNNFLFHKKSDLIKQTALFIFLNKTCFNGLYRVNQKGEFNVPWNKDESVTLYSKNNIEAINDFLTNNDITFFCQDFGQILSKVQKRDFVYLDPPYDLVKKDSFVSYTKDKFLDSEQKRLASFFDKLDKKGCFVALSNHDTDTVRKLYAKHHIQTVSAKRMINCQGTKRGAVDEVIITNYVPENKVSSLKTNQSNSQTNHNHVPEKKVEFLNVKKLPEWYIDFEKVKKHTTLYRQQIDQLQRTVSLPNLKTNLFNLAQKDVNFLKLLFLLIGQRWDNWEMLKEWDLNKSYVLTTKNWDKIFIFLEGTGLIQTLTSKTVKRLFDYVFGMEAGLDSNARKNRTGKVMEEQTRNVLERKKQNGEIDWLETQTKIGNLVAKYNLALPKLSSNILEKQFDFICFKQNTLYLLEVNCYNTTGSKVNETIRSYQKINDEINQLNLKIEFVWVTDGIYWQKNRKKWINSRQKIKHLLSLSDFEKF